MAMVPDIVPPDFLEDSELMVNGLPQLYFPCSTITISSKHVLKKVAKQLGVLIHGYSFTPLDKDVAATVTMDVPPHRGNPVMKSHEFHGEWTTLHTDAKESACLAALTYLKDAGLIVVHDTNFAAMNKYKRKFEAEHFWSSMLYEHVDSLKKPLSAKSDIPARISSHDQSGSTPSSIPTASVTDASTKANEGERMRCRARKALFVKK